MAYATVADLAAHLGVDPPDNADQLLVKASRKVDTHLIAAWYPVDDDGAPTDPQHIAAMRDAVCAQIEWWIETGDLTGTGAATEWSSVSIGKLSLSRGGGGAAGSSGGPGARKLASDAAEILHLAGLTPVSPWLYG